MLKGYHLIGVYNTTTALTILEKMKFDAVIADLHFKTNSATCFEGFEVIEKIRKKDKHLPIIAVSSYESEQLAATKATRLGANAFILKEEFSRKKWNKLLNGLINYSLS